MIWGANWDDVKRDVADDISPFLVDPNAEPDERDGQINAANRRAELLLRTHGFQAYQAASYQVMDRQRDVLPYWQYLTMEDDRVRPEHACLDKLILPANDPFWESHFPPWDFGCRCQCVPISQEERDDQAAKDQKKAPDQRLVLDGPQLDRAGWEVVRDGRRYDTRPPTQKEGASGYSWNPGSLRLPLDKLKGRYDPEVWAEFEMWARKTPLGENQPTVWEWLKGASIDKPDDIEPPSTEPASVPPEQMAQWIDHPQGKLDRSFFQAYLLGGSLYDELQRGGTPQAEALSTLVRAIIPYQSHLPIWRVQSLSGREAVADFLSKVQAEGFGTWGKTLLSASKELGNFESGAMRHFGLASMRGQEAVMLKIINHRSARSMEEVTARIAPTVVSDREVVFLKGTKFRYIGSE